MATSFLLTRLFSLAIAPMAQLLIPITAEKKHSYLLLRKSYYRGVIIFFAVSVLIIIFYMVSLKIHNLFNFDLLKSEVFHYLNFLIFAIPSMFINTFCATFNTSIGNIRLVRSISVASLFLFLITLSLGVLTNVSPDQYCYIFILSMYITSFLYLYRTSITRRQVGNGL